jgi:VPDSG-CTERM motif
MRILRKPLMVAAVASAITFHAHGQANLTVQGIVGTWGGSLFGGNSPQGLNSLLATTADQVYSSPGGVFVPVTVTIPGGVALTPGDPYFFGLTISGASEFASSTGVTEWATVGNGVPGSLGGGFNFDNNGNNFGALTTTWDDFANFGTLEFSATFAGSPSGAPTQTSSTVPSWTGGSISAFGVPNTTTYGESFIAPAGATALDSYTFYIEAESSNAVPDAGTTSCMFGLALAGLAALRRKLS